MPPTPPLACPYMVGYYGNPCGVIPWCVEHDYDTTSLTATVDTFSPLVSAHSSGVDSMSNYEQVIRQVHYYNWQPGQISDRRFRLTCSELNGRYTSNEFNLEVSVKCSLCKDYPSHAAER